MALTFKGVNEFTFSTDNKVFSGLCNETKDAPILLCLHGYLDNAASFIPMMPYLHQFKVVALDLAGHGNAQHRAAGHGYHLTDYAFDVVQFVSSYLREIGQQKIFLVGHSLGGIVGSIVAACYPELIKAFILIEAFGPLVQDETTSAKQLRDSFDSRMNLQSNSKEKRSLEQIIAARAAISGFGENNARMIVERNLQILEDGVEWKSDKALRTKSAMRMTEKQACNILSSILSPTALFLGDEGFEKTKVNMQKRIEFMQSLMDVKSFSGGHHVHMESPQAVAENAIQFFNNYAEYSLS